MRRFIEDSSGNSPATRPGKSEMQSREAEMHLTTK
jgi:hypothetical protein